MLKHAAKPLCCTSNRTTPSHLPKRIRTGIHTSALLAGVRRCRRGGFSSVGTFLKTHGPLQLTAVPLCA